MRANESGIILNFPVIRSESSEMNSHALLFSITDLKKTNIFSDPFFSFVNVFNIGGIEESSKEMVNLIEETNKKITDLYSEIKDLSVDAIHKKILFQFMLIMISDIKKCVYYRICDKLLENIFRMSISAYEEIKESVKDPEKKKIFIAETIENLVLLTVLYMGHPNNEEKKENIRKAVLLLKEINIHDNKMEILRARIYVQAGFIQQEELLIDKRGTFDSQCHLEHPLSFGCKQLILEAKKIYKASDCRSSYLGVELAILASFSQRIYNRFSSLPSCYDWFNMESPKKVYLDLVRENPAMKNTGLAILAEIYSLSFRNDTSQIEWVDLKSNFSMGLMLYSDLALEFSDQFLSFSLNREGSDEKRSFLYFSLRCLELWEKIHSHISQDQYEKRWVEIKRSELLGRAYYGLFTVEKGESRKIFGVACYLTFKRVIEEKENLNILQSLLQTLMRLMSFHIKESNIQEFEFRRREIKVLLDQHEEKNHFLPGFSEIFFMNCVMFHFNHERYYSMFIVLDSMLHLFLREVYRVGPVYIDSIRQSYQNMNFILSSGSLKRFIKETLHCSFEKVSADIKDFNLSNLDFSVKENNLVYLCGFLFLINYWIVACGKNLCHEEAYSFLWEKMVSEINQLWSKNLRVKVERGQKNLDAFSKLYSNMQQRSDVLFKNRKAPLIRDSQNAKYKKYFQCSIK